MGFFERPTRAGIRKLIQSMMSKDTDIAAEKQFIADAVAVKELNDKINDVEVLDLDNTSTFPRGTGINGVSGRFVRYGRLVIINIYWYGDITRNAVIITVPARFRPAAYAYGVGVIYQASSAKLSVGLGGVSAGGVLYDATTLERKLSGTYSISYIIGM